MATTHDKLGRPLRDLRISVTDRCNFRCPYCMPAEVFGERHPFLPRESLLTFEEIERVSRIAVGLGVRKVRVTGGEPLLRAELPELVRRLAALEGLEDLALTTNGVRLPQLAGALREAGLDRLTISLDALDPAAARRMSGNKSDGTDTLAGIAAAEAAGFSRLKINCVVIRGENDDQIVPLARHFHGTPHVVRFIEYMDVGTRNDWHAERVVPEAEIVERIAAELPLEPAERTSPHATASRWRYRDGGGEIGVIASITRPFCGACTRLRLSTDGRLVTCLFATTGIDLRGPMREGASDEELGSLLGSTWTRRTDRYSEERTADPEGKPRRIEMYELGG